MHSRVPRPHAEAIRAVRGVFALAVAIAVVASCNGVEPTPVTMTTGDLDGAVSSDGAWVVFDRLDSGGAPALYRARLDGTQRQLILNGASSADWSPDGAMVAGNTGSNVITVELATGDVAVIASGTGPAYSPDGATLAFSSIGPFAGPPDLWTAPASGGPATRVPLPGPPHDELRDPDWSPDGSWLVATRAAGQFALFLTRLDGTDTSVISVAGWESSHPAWSPQSNRIAYVRSGDDVTEVWLVNPDGSSHRRVAVAASHPHWYPDGSRLLITKRIANALSLWSVDTLGQNLVRLWNVP